MLLALDTSTAYAGICLMHPATGRVVEERVWHTGIRHSEQLIPTVDAALRQHGLGPDALSAIAVAVGPGTFNGVRVAVATAKLLASARGLPLVGVDTLELYARPGMLVRPLLSAARGEAATALFRGAERLEEDRVAGPEELFRPPAEPTLFTGELTDEWRAAIAQLGPSALLASPAEALRRSSTLAEIALGRLARGETDDHAALQAIYLRAPHITQARR